MFGFFVHIDPHIRVSKRRVTQIFKREAEYHRLLNFTLCSHIQTIYKNRPFDEKFNSRPITIKDTYWWLGFIQEGEGVHPKIHFHQKNAQLIYSQCYAKIAYKLFRQDNG